MIGRDNLPYLFVFNIFQVVSHRLQRTLFLEFRRRFMRVLKLKGWLVECWIFHLRPRGLA